MEIVLEVWGDFACFARPESKVERLTYPVPTPSSVRGILSSVYSKPREFMWQVNRIEVLNPIRYISFKRNEVKSKVRDKPIFTDDDRTQRQTVALRDVRYRFAASICPARISEAPRPSCMPRRCAGYAMAKPMYSPHWASRNLWLIFRRATPPDRSRYPSIWI